MLAAANDRVEADQVLQRIHHLTLQVAQLGLLNVLIHVGGGCFVEAVDPALGGWGMATPTGSRPWRLLHVSLERIAVLFE